MKALFKALSSVGQDGGSTLLDRIQGAIEAAFNRIGDVVSNDTLIPIALPIGPPVIPGGIGTPVDTNIPHGLGHRITAWEVVRKSGPADIWESPSQPMPDRFLTLRSSALVTVTLRIS